ncbi:MAG: ORF6N domain-containing protein, partial [Bdellovibrionia bacterium]
RIYGVATKRLNEQVKRNLGRFPQDFMFQLTEADGEILRSQIATSRLDWGGRRFLPYVFTEHGAVMLASVLNSEIAVQASVQVVRAFISLRQLLSSHEELARKVDSLEKKYDGKFQSVFEAFRKLMTSAEVPRRRIGIKSDD